MQDSDISMALPTLGQSSLELLDKLDEQLKGCTPLEECSGEQGYGLDYAMRLEAIRKVSYSLGYPASMAKNYVHVCISKFVVAIVYKDYNLCSTYQSNLPSGMLRGFDDGDTFPAWMVEYLINP